MLFDPAEANHFSPMRIDLYCFPSKLERQPSKCQNFEAQSHSLFSRCLRLATTITDSHPRLATGGWLDLTRQAFHLLDYSPLSGRTTSNCRFLYIDNVQFISLFIIFSSSKLPTCFVSKNISLFITTIIIAAITTKIVCIHFVSGVMFIFSCIIFINK